jgi:AbrB family looped-hinge helix DNA binding protein
MNTQKVKLDKKGRLIIPNAFRESLGMKTGESVVLTEDKENGRIIAYPIEKNVRKLEILLGDQPGALASAAAILRDHNVDLVYTESRSIKRGKEAIWTVVADFTKCNMSALKKALAKERFK